MRSGSHVGVLYGIRAFLNDKTDYHLWFLYALAGLYLFVPVISWFTETDRRKRSLYFVTLWLVAPSLVPFFNKIASYVTEREVRIALDLRMFGGYSGYLVVGALLGNNRASNALKWLCLCALAAAIASTAGATTCATRQSGSYVSYFYEFLSPNVIVIAAAGFVLLKELGLVVSQNARASFVIERVSRASFGIYLMHPMFLDLIRDTTFGSALASAGRSTAVFIPFIAVIAVLLSYVVTEIILRVLLIRRIV